jgi:hypothetical protein
VALQDRLQYGEAAGHYRRALEVDGEYADAHWNLSLALLTMGNMPEGWREYEWRWKMRGLFQPRSFARPLWDGKAAQGRTILLHAEQGMGDTLQFIRYAPLVAERGLTVIVECQQEVAELVRGVRGIHQVVARGQQLPAFDVHCPLLTLPLLFGTTVESIPAQAPYLAADRLLQEQWRERLAASAPGLKAGLVWAGKPTHRKDSRRSCALSAFAPLARVEGISWHSLQKGEAAQQAAHPPEGMQLTDWTDEMKDFSVTAALVANLDLCISVDTSVAHLAGALGKPVWTLLPYEPDWRWMLGREDSPWYPTMRLFRQELPGQWGPVMARLAGELQRMKKQ